MASHEGEQLLKTKSPHMTETEWVSFEWTLVEYPKGDWIGKILAFASVAPFAIAAGFVTLILFRRDLHTIAFFIGLVLNGLLSQLLKAIICDPRPIQRAFSHADYGMPSSHAQFSWFFATYVIYFVFIRLHHMNNNTTLENVWKAVIVVGCVILAFVVCISRVYLQYHSWKQVICGAILGGIMGSIWFALTHLLFSPYFPIIVSWRISELLLLRDTTLIPNVLWFEYTNTRQEARARGRKLVSMKSQ